MVAERGYERRQSVRDWLANKLAGRIVRTVTVFSLVIGVTLVVSLASVLVSSAVISSKMASGGHYKTPPLFLESKPYSRWVDEIKVWQAVTDLDKKKQGAAIALSLPENEGSTRDKVFSELGVDKLNSVDGAETLISFMDKIYKKDELSAAYEYYTEFDRYQRTSQVSMESYVAEFEKLYNRTKKYNMTLPQSVLAFKLLEGAGLEHKDRQLVLTGVDYSDMENLFKQMTTSLVKFFGKQSMPSGACSNENISIKVEPTFIAESDSAYFTGAHYPRGSRNSNTFRGRWRGRGTKYQGYNSTGNNFSRTSNVKRISNPVGPDGNPMRCKICESIFHFARACPDSYENLAKQSERKVEEAALFTGNKMEEMQTLVCESMNAAVLDSACSSTVTGQMWLDCYLDTLSPEDLHKVTRSESESVFKFGGGTRLKSKEKVTFPAKLAGVKCQITSDVVDSDIPLLLGKPSMKAAKVHLDLENDRASMFGHDIDLQCTSSGHYCVPLDDVCDNEVYDVMFTMNEKSIKEQKQIITKLHKQFAHPSSARLITLLKDAGSYTEECTKIVEEITQNCDTCKKYKKTPARPVTCIPLASEFNEVVAMDLKEWKHGVYFLHLIDLATRFSLAAVIYKKTPSTIIDNVMKLWIGSGMGPPRKFLADNGGEFANEEYRDMAQNLNIEVWNSAGFSPWQNGICERNHAVVDDCVERILFDNPKLELETALVWAINAKNSLQMVHGWSPYQLVFGSNPNLPSVLIDKPPALGGSTISEMFAKHLNTLYASRKAFIQSECSERIRRALRHQIRPSNTVFQTGDKVYYRRGDQWRGPGKVLGQDGKIVFVRHGSVYVRVSPCRLIKVGEEFNSSTKCEENNSRTAQEVAFQENNKPEPLDEHNEQFEHTESNTSNPPNVKHLPKVKDKIKYRLSTNKDWIEASIISRGGKTGGKYQNWFNICDTESNAMKCVDFASDDVQWEPISNNVSLENNRQNDEVLDKQHNVSTSAADMSQQGADMEVSIVSDLCSESEEVHKAKLNELDNWKNFQVFEEVTDNGQSFITTRWVITEKVLDNQIKVKARLVARGFEEEENIQSDSPTARKETLRILLAITATFGWSCNTIDIKAAFLQGNQIERNVHLKPPKEANSDGKLWRLRKCVYGLNDASRSWYFSVCDELTKLGCTQSQIDPALFYCHVDNILAGLFIMHVDDFIWSGTNMFKQIMEKLQSKFKIGRQEHGVFKYLGLDLKQDNGEIILDQHSYIKNIFSVPLHASRAAHKQDPLNKIEITQLRSSIGQISWVANQTRPDVCFDVLELSISVKEPKVQDLIHANKILKQLAYDVCDVKFPALGNINDLKLAIFCDASYAN